MFRQKSHWWICLGIVSLTLSSILWADIESDLVGYWPLDEGEGDIAMDASGNDVPVNLVNSPEWVAGQFGNAVLLNGMDQFLQPDGFELNSDTVTLCAWLNGHRGANWTGIMMSRDNSTAAGMGYGGNDKLHYTWNSNSTWSWDNGPVIPADEWAMVALTIEPSQAVAYVFDATNGLQFSTNAVAHSAELIFNPRFGADFSDHSRNYPGIIDEVRIYNRALSADDVLQLAQGPGTAFPYASQALPKHRSILDAPPATLSWKAGDLAISSNVYLGTDAAAVAAATPESPEFLDNTMEASVTLAESLVRGVTYYWRIDSVNDAEPNSPWAGPVWSFFIQPLTAYAPTPADGITYVLRDQTLSWTPGVGNLLSSVYFGTDADTVAEATGAPLQLENTFTPTVPLDYGTTYYWRVDQFTGIETVKGPVWSFTAVPTIAVTDADLLGWWKFDEEGAASIVDSSGHDLHGAITGTPQWIPGVADKAILLDGSTYGLTSVPDVNTNTLSITAWIRPDNTKAWSGVLYTRGGGFDAGLSIAGGNELRYAWNGGKWDFQSGLVLADLEWAFVALVVESEKATIVMNELTAVNDQDVTHAAKSIGAGLGLGVDTQGGRQFTGAIDDLRIYTKSLTMDEVKTIMNQGQPPVKELDPLMIDDFDGYRSYMDEAEPNVWDVWVDGFGDPTNGSVSGYLDPPFLERVNAAAGGQALPLQFDNLSGDTSGVTRTFSPVLDLSAEGATALKLYVRGDQNNDAEITTAKVFISLTANGSTNTVTLLEAGDIAKTKWQEIHIALSSLAVDITQISEIRLGVSSGGVGTVYIDNITRAQ